MLDTFTIYPIGMIHKDNHQVSIEIFEAFRDGLFGLEHFSHIIVFSWFDRNDTVEKRHTLKVHPRGNKKNPLTGVFATRSPVRPNLIAISTCKILSIEDTIIHVDRIDSFDRTPVIDIKPCLPGDVSMDIKVPQWV
ncbi:MAG: tRNA (N6-threonylcarbamoyladenosine(37)-N6)-methyltransferase TrmO [Deltaproteobacteria bacterium]|nr:tRNA (N6-threonylcarbamoyladenosine(37)-N6)-methyltransferase TrmO [Deltaproteobacteria bacterium]